MRFREGLLGLKTKGSELLGFRRTKAGSWIQKLLVLFSHSS